MPSLGFYKLTVRAVGTNREELAAQKSTCAAEQQRTSVGLSDFGMCTHFAHNKGMLPKSLDLVKLAGFSRIRDELYWQRVEPTPDNFAFPTQYDNYINAAAEKGTRAPSYPEFWQRHGVSAAVRRPDFSQHRRRPAAFRQLCASMRAALWDKIKDWEVWNEPQSWGKVSPAIYTDLLKVVYPAVKVVDKNANVISCSGGGAGGGLGGGYITGVLKAGGLDFQGGSAFIPMSHRIRRIWVMAPKPPRFREDA